MCQFVCYTLNMLIQKEFPVCHPRNRNRHVTHPMTAEGAKVGSGVENIGMCLWHGRLCGACSGVFAGGTCESQSKSLDYCKLLRHNEFSRKISQKNPPTPRRYSKVQGGPPPSSTVLYGHTTGIWPNPMRINTLRATEY